MILTFASTVLVRELHCSDRRFADAAVSLLTRFYLGAVVNCEVVRSHCASRLANTSVKFVNVVTTLPLMRWTAVKRPFTIAVSP